MDMTTPQTSEHPVGEQQPQPPVDVQEVPQPAFGLAGEPAQPVREEPVAEEPVAVEPVAVEPVAVEPVAEEPGAEEPVRQPAPQPVAEEPAPEPVAVAEAPEPVVQEPVVQEPVVQEPVVQEPVVQEAEAPQPVAQEPVVEEQPPPMVEEPVVQEPVVEEQPPPVVQEPMVQEPMVQEPVVQETVVEEQPQPEAQVPMQPIYDKEGQFEKVQAGLLQGEQIIAVYDIKGAGDGMVGITNMRLIIQDNSFVGGKVALTSVPYGRIHAVSYLADKSMFGKFFSESSICVTTSGHDYVMEFRSVEKAKHIHDVVLAYAMGA